jgi:hypothetical protein
VFSALNEIAETACYSGVLAMIAALIVSGFALSLTLFLVMQRTGRLKLFLGYAGYVDLIFTILIFGLFAHTFSGVVAGTFAGLFLALGLTLMRNLMGYERIGRKGIRFVIVKTEGKWAPGRSVRATVTNIKQRIEPFFAEETAA